jgi:predicted RNase H-like nuclease (RuvC/YqgF family)
MASTIVVALVSAWSNRKSRNEKREIVRQKKLENDRLEQERKKLDEEYDEISERARKRAVAGIEERLASTQQQLTDALEDADRLRIALREKNQVIDEQDSKIAGQTRKISRQTRRIEALEDWIDDHAEALGVDGLPDDILDDRRHSVTGTAQDDPM